MRCLSLIILFTVAQSLSAMLVLPEGYPHQAEVELYQIVLLHRHETEKQEMLLRLWPRFEHEPPAKAMWIVPLPAPATGYNEVRAGLDGGPDLHEHLYAVARRQWADRTQYTWPRNWNWPPKREREPQEPEPRLTADGELVGWISIMSVRETGREGFERLSSRLSERGYNAPDSEAFRWHIDNDFAYLCIELLPGEEGGVLPANPEMPVVRVAVDTPEPYLPVFSLAAHPEFPFDATMITDQPLRARPFRFTMDALRARLHGYVSLINLWSVQPLPADLGPAFSDDLQAGIGEGDTRLFVNRVEGRVTTAVDEDRIRLEGELLLELGGVRDELPGFWYYGDDEIGFIERFFRQHLLATVGLFFGAFVLLLVIKSFSNKRRRRLEAQARTVRSEPESDTMNP
jgi:hypothetical protein